MFNSMKLGARAHGTALAEAIIASSRPEYVSQRVRWDTWHAFREAGEYPRSTDFTPVVPLVGEWGASVCRFAFWTACERRLGLEGPATIAQRAFEMGWRPTPSEILRVCDDSREEVEYLQ